MITLIGIARKEKSRALMQELDAVNISLEAGVEGDFRGKPGKRQVTVLSVESWQDTCSDLQSELPWTFRRANLLIEGFRFSEQDVGKVIEIGDLKLLITQETDPCPRMDEQHQGLTESLVSDWRGGVCCKVLSAGQVKIGDTVQIKLNK